ncbi:ABC transporter permease [Micromonospora sp. NBC_01655]|uniref:ABC transporter permease n=1 Tax=Micromonospora sp. NBC_01655 TaxID=2975983 RepID=UPI00224E7D3B|nr:ABC transporter permease [Micromonospora sp. NBC_01655]MCX4471395.1 ABC transporter permease [Micromonospora sp. NBC_01655]
MLQMSWQTFRARWQLFAGAFVAVALGVALVHSSLLLLMAAVDPVLPAGLSATEVQRLRAGYDGTSSLLAMVLTIAGFLAVFVVGSTFAFTVAQRRTELATLRLNGGSRWQLRRLLLGEALILGLLGSAAGIACTEPVLRGQLAVLRSFEFVPDSFDAPWRGWTPVVSVGVGVVVGLCGVFSAAQRAARVEPLEALRETGAARRVMTASRWVVGGLFLTGTVAIVASAPSVPADYALPLYLGLCMTLAVTLNAFAPLVVPLASRVLGVIARGPLGELAMANLRAGVRRTSSIAAPVLVLVAIVGGLAGSVDTVSTAMLRERTESLTGELRVRADRPVGAELAALPGMRAVSAEAGVNLGPDNPTAIAVDPAAYQATHRVEVTAGDFAAVVGDGVAVRANATPGRVFSLGDELLAPDGRRLRVVALLPPVLNDIGMFVPAAMGTEQAGTGYWLRTDQPDQVAAAIRAAGLGEVTSRADWLEDFRRSQRRDSNAVLLALLGAGTLYAAIAVVNAVMIGAADRRAEFAAARLTGLTRRQVVRTALLESLAVVGIGLTLGGLAGAGTIYGVSRSLADLTGHWHAEVPWALISSLTLAAVLLVTTASTLSTLAATRIPAIRLAGAGN